MLDIVRAMGNRDTAMFFDLENVLGGYGKNLSSRLEQVSLPAIVQAIRQHGGTAGVIKEFAVKRAYADWSVTRLASLRRQLVEQGIEPRQTFAFGSQGKTNAADVELVIDVLDLAYMRPEISTFVIVSGDGGFGTLVRKLHEFGKTVVIGAYERDTSRGLRAVCDYFVDLSSADLLESSEPVESTSEATPETVQTPIARNGAIAPTRDYSTNSSADGSASPVNTLTISEIIDDAVAQVGDLSQHPILERATLLINHVIGIDTLQETIRDDGLNVTYVPPILGQIARDEMLQEFGKLSRLLSAAQAGAAWCLAKKVNKSGVYALVYRDSIPLGMSPMSDQAIPSIAERAGFQLMRARLPLPEPIDDLYTVMNALEVAPIRAEGQLRQEVIDRMIADDLASDIPVDSIKRCLSVLLTAGTLALGGPGHSQTDRIHVQKLSTEELMLNSVRAAVIAALVEGGIDGVSYWQELTGEIVSG